MKKLTAEEFIEKARKIFPQYDYSQVEYINAQTKVKIICPKCGLQEIKATYILSGRGCKCEPNKYYTKKPRKELNQSELQEKFPNFEIDFSTFTGNFSNIKIKCKKCNNFFERNINNLKRKSADCPWCTGRYQTTDTIVEKLKERYGAELFDFSKVKYLKNNRDEQTIICKKCGKEFKSNIHALLVEGRKCPFCSSSSMGEQKIVLELERLGYIFQKDFFKEKIFDDLKGEKQYLRFDFYIPSKNLLIEYDGEQHFKPKEIFGGEKEFTKRKRYDKIKTEYAKKNGYKLIRIPFYDFDKIGEILNESIR